ncbi:MAG: hypothetical protein ACLGI6_12970 [Gammaproteobacteria bacterium]
MRHFHRVAVLIAVLLLGGCSHTVYIHEPPAGGFKLERPRYLLKATLALQGAGEDNRAVHGLLERSGYFSTLQQISGAPPSGQFDIDIAYKGVQCGEGESPVDSFGGTWFWTAKFVLVTVPTLGVVPPGAGSETPCQQVFAYRLRSPRNAQARSVSYPFKAVEYVTTAPALYATGDKRQFQKDFLMDQSVAALLSDIAAQLSKN